MYYILGITIHDNKEWFFFFDISIDNFIFES